MCFRPLPPLFPPQTWNVHEATLANDARTNNECESWNNSYRHLVGHAHPSIWTTIESLQMDQAQVSTSLMNHARGQPIAKRVHRSTVQLQSRQRNLCERKFDNNLSVEAFL